MGNQLAVTRPSATLIEYVADGRNGRNSKAHMQLRKDLTPFDPFSNTTDALTIKLNVYLENQSQRTNRNFLKRHHL